MKLHPEVEEFEVCETIRLLRYKIQNFELRYAY